MQTAGIEIIQPHINRLLRRARLHALIDILHDVAKPQARPIIAIEQRQLGPIWIGLELFRFWQSGGHALALNSRSNWPTTLRMSSKVGTSPKNIGPSICS